MGDEDQALFEADSARRRDPLDEKVATVVDRGQFAGERPRRRLIERARRAAVKRGMGALVVELTPELDGVILLSHLRGEVPVEARTVFWRSNRWGVQHAVRQGDWKYLRVDEPHPSPGRANEVSEFLFNLSVDPGETTNLAGQESAVFERLQRIYAEWEAGVLPRIEPMTSPLS